MSERREPVVPASIESLPVMDVGGRVGRLRAQFDAAEVDALLVTFLPNVRYLTGFTGSAAMLLVTGDTLLFTTDGRYRTQSGEQLAAAGVEADIEVGATVAAQREALAAGLPEGARVGLEAHAVTWSQQRAFAETLGGRALVPTEGLVERLRRVKEPGEVARIHAACRVADDALAAMLPRLSDGVTEREFALELEVQMRRRGASGNSFDPIVASGPNAAKPHARPSARRVEPAELVVIDFGCVVDGYCSDMTRTVSVGDPGLDARRLWEVVRESQWAGREAVRAGAECAEVDRACRDVIAAAGWGDAFVHGTGHGVGLEIHEAPRVAASARDTLEPGAVVTVEPGVYLPGVGGVRIEDTVVVTPAGSDPLTAFPKELVL
ncbi:MAG TPA: aminopeptidase P family protein [Acidimicrobiia bacterium]|jgi:Xaa-Pro aminopeptidase